MVAMILDASKASSYKTIQLPLDSFDMLIWENPYTISEI